MARERRLNEIEALIEQRLPRFLRPQDRESVGGERCRGHRLDPALRGKSHPFVDRFFRREVERVRNGVSGGGRDRLRVALVLEPSRRKTDKVDRRKPRDGDARERKLLVMKRPIAAPIRRLFSGTTAVWRIGRPRGRRRSATTANQSAQAPTIPASAKASRYGAQIQFGGARRIARKITAIRTSSQRGDDTHTAQFSPALRLNSESVRISERHPPGGRKSGKFCHRKIPLVQSDQKGSKAIIGASYAPAIERFPTRRKSKRTRAARPSHLPAKRLNNPCGAGWRVRTIFLGAVRSLWGLSLSRLVGFGIWLPPTYVGARDHRPTAVSAPRFILDVFFGLATP